MPAIAFDTLRAKQALTAAGFPENQAAAIVVMTGDALTEGVATKTDIGDLKSDIAQLEVKLDAKIDKTAAQIRGEIKSEIAQLEVKLDGKIDKTAAQLRGDFKSDIAQLRGEIKSEIAQLDAKIDKTADLLRAEIKSEGAKIEAKIEAKIDARISGLESKILRIAISTALGAGTATVGLVAILVKLL